MRSSTKDQIKGFDCAHFSMDKEDVCLWLGEAKFHNSIDNAISGAFASIGEHVKIDYLKSEFKILGSNIEANRGISPDYMSKLRSSFQGKSISSIKIKIPVLLTYNCMHIQAHEELSDELYGLLKRRFYALKEKIESKIPVLPSNISLVFILFPFGAVEKVKTYLESAEKFMK